MAQIKYNLGTVGGMAVTELWSGSVGHLTGSAVLEAKITLNDDLTNYKFLIFDFYCSYNGNDPKVYYSRVIPVQQFINLFNNAATALIAFTWGFGNLNDAFYIRKDSTTNVLNTDSQYTQCLRVVGIS